MDIPLCDLLYARLDGNLNEFILQNVMESLGKRGTCTAHISEEDVTVLIMSPSGVEVFRFEFPLNEQIFSMFFTE